MAAIFGFPADFLDLQHPFTWPTMDSLVRGLNAATQMVVQVVELPSNQVTIYNVELGSDGLFYICFAYRDHFGVVHHCRLQSMFQEPTYYMRLYNYDQYIGIILQYIDENSDYRVIIINNMLNYCIVMFNNCVLL